MQGGWVTALMQASGLGDVWGLAANAGLASIVRLGSPWGMQQLWPLLLLPLALLPWLLRGQLHFAHPALQGLPEDPLSQWLERAWKLANSVLIVALALALCGPYLKAGSVERIGRGAHVMIVLDRSASMNEPFVQSRSASAHAASVKSESTKYESAKSENERTNAASASPSKLDARQPKMEVARQVLKTLVSQGHDDLLGMVTFSTSPILAAPLGNDRAYVQAALEATEAGGMGFTAVARGLGMALDYFADQPVTGARAVVLVSDGGAHLDGKTQDMLRAMFMRQKAALYWIYLRSENGVSLNSALAEGESIDAYPEVALHDYFKTLNVPYRVYEAENPQAVMHAVNDIARLKNKPTRYQEPVARQDLSQYAYVVAWLATALLIAMSKLELTRWQTR